MVKQTRTILIKIKRVLIDFFLKKNIIKVIKTNICLHMELNQLMGFSKVDMT